jgi:hypothetical protein
MLLSAPFDGSTVAIIPQRPFTVAIIDPSSLVSYSSQVFWVSKGERLFHAMADGFDREFSLAVTPALKNCKKSSRPETGHSPNFPLHHDHNDNEAAISLIRRL